MNESLHTGFGWRISVPPNTLVVVIQTGKRGLVSLLAALLADMALAQQPGAFDKAAVLLELDKLEQSHSDKIAVEQKGIKETLGKALSSTKSLLDLYEEAVFATKFEGAKRDNSEFKRWKNAQDDTLKADDFQAALELHANYLYLTFLRASGEEEPKLVEAVIQHVLKVWALEAKYDLHKRANAELLDRPVNQGVLARRYHLGPKLGGPQEGEKPKEQDKTWEWFPAGTDGMLDRTALPYLRAKKSPALITLWDKRIANESARAKRSGLSDRAAQITQQTLPKLNWQRAADLVLLGKEAEGFSTMIGVLRQNANHADFNKFAQELRALLTGGASTSAAQSQ
jgi:hypothetical protein